MQYVILDFETTGLDPADSEIIEIGAIRVDGLAATDRFHRLVKPHGHLPQVISQLTGITPEMLENERPLDEIEPEFVEFIGELPVVAHNSSLEQKFLDHHVRSKTFTVHNSILPLAMLLPDHGSHSMESMRKWAGVSVEGSHRADKDCEDLLAVLVHARDFAKRERPWIGGIVRQLLEGRWWWNWYFDSDAGEAPERPFRGDLKELRSDDSGREIDWEKAKLPPEKVRAALEGGLADAFRFRESQERMAQEVRQALAAGERLAIEAPTGTGKSVAYLLPGVLAAEATGAPLVVSTHSKALQDQLFEKDIPLVRGLLARPELRATTVKGQDNYLCLRKLNDLMESVTDEANEEERWAIAYLLAFSSVSPVAELDRVSHYLKSQNTALETAIDRVRSNHLTTIGPACPFYKQCHFFDSARLAHQSDVIIANHALVFQWPTNLPQIRNIVFDEAHHLEDRITEAYSVRLSEEDMTESLERLTRKRGKRQSSELAQIARLLGEPEEKLEQLVEAVRSRLSQTRQVVPLALPKDRDSSDGYEEMIDFGRRPPPTLVDAVTNLAGALGDLRKHLADGVSKCEQERHPRNDPAFDTLMMQSDRFESFEQRVRSLLPSTETVAGAPSRENFLRLIYWHPREQTWRLQVAPIDVSTLAEPFFGGKRAVVLTSATLSGGAMPTFVTDRIGLKLSRPFVSLPSPYSLDKQALVYFPEGLPPPGTPSHLEKLIEFAEQSVSLLGGRTLLLMTSNRRLSHAAEILRDKLTPKGITVFDSVSDRRAAEGFKASERALLIGGERYGEGLDIPGRALTCVIVEKINEAMTRSPLAEARKARTKFGLYDYDFPLRMMWLKQRVGRLVRASDDTGVVIVFDPRFHSWSAGSRNQVIKALAPMPIRAGDCERILREMEGMHQRGKI